MAKKGPSIITGSSLGLEIPAWKFKQVVFCITEIVLRNGCCFYGVDLLFIRRMSFSAFIEYEVTFEEMMESWSGNKFAPHLNVKENYHVSGQKRNINICVIFTYSFVISTSNLQRTFCNSKNRFFSRFQSFYCQQSWVIFQTRRIIRMPCAKHGLDKRYVVRGNLVVITFRFIHI
jgi:hypothetical protein